MSEKYEGGWFDLPRVIDPHKLGTVMVECFSAYLTTSSLDSVKCSSKWLTGMHIPST